MRNQLELILSFLENAEDDIGRTQLRQKTNLSYSCFDEYLKFLLKKELLEERQDEKHKFYVTTAEGSILTTDINKVLRKLSMSDKNVVKRKM